MISSVYPHKKVSCCPHIPNSNPKFHFWTSVFLHFFLLFFTSLPRQEVLATTLLIVGAGVRPRQELAESCGLELGGRGGIKVRMGHQGGWARGGAGFGALLMFCFCFSPFNPLFFLGSLLCFNAWNFRNTGGNWMSYCNMSSPRFFGKLFGDWSDRHGDTSMIFIAACLEWI